MAKPLLYPEWATTDTTLPATGNTNKQRPKESLRNTGWDKGQIPTAEEWNWQFDNISNWIEWFDENNITDKTFTLTGDTEGSASYTNEGGLSIETITSQAAHADVADKWTTSRTISFTGFANGNANIDGSGNVSINLSQGAGSLHAMTKTLLLSTSSVNSSVSVNIPNSLFGGITPSFVMFSANANSTVQADITGYTLNVGTSQNLADVLMACGTDDTDQGNGRIYAASTFVLPYSTTQDFYVAARAYGAFTCTTNIYIVGYQL